MKEIKNQMRQEMRHNRKIYHQTIEQDEIDQTLIAHMKEIEISKDKIISGYIAKGSEINITGLMKFLHTQGYKVCLPVVESQDQTLIFRQWTPDTQLINDAESVLAPGCDAPLLDPDVLLIPLLAFDTQGHRLGQGMGYYDKTLKFLAQQRSILAIGVAYDCQHVSAVPCRSKDYNMDMMITDKAIYRF